MINLILRYDLVMRQIDELHMSSGAGTYQLLLRSIFAKWDRWDMKKFKDYFRRQWIESKFKNWQIFLTPAGYSHTNSPIESYNNSIKAHFTKRVRFHLKPALEVFAELVVYESKNLKNIVKEGLNFKYMCKIN